jgi:hypothetical protein
MTDDELRALVRDAVARHLGGGATAGSASDPGAAAIQAPGVPVSVPLWRAHASFGKFVLPTGSEQDGPCLIEPAVRCNHCGYCLSYGH